MKRSLSVHLILMTAILGIVVTGCKPRQKSLTPIPGQGSTVQGGGLNEGDVIPLASGQSIGEDLGTGGFEQSGAGRATEANSMADREMFSAQTVYFDFDSNVVKPSEVSKVEVVAQHLLANPRHSVRIEGHCDERGTEEYNRALGERRANSIREMLINMGVPGDAVFTVSYGEDIPAVEGSNEAAWSQNRRGEFVLLTPL